MTTADMIGLISYSSATFSQLVLYHWLGNEIMFKSTKIIESCYLSEWYQLSKTSQKSLMLLMERAKRPLVIELAKRPLVIELYSLIYISLDTLAVIIRWAYSLVALIKASYN
ncbi:7tm Odorant receptor [Popillia japonica]|uniref:7tm Odorant receptor n=1 Tax=Popillia japonica TaxID=7064 RepID=A0AAW1HWJ4_POPJA